MDYEQDYILRVIRDSIRMIAKLVLGKDKLTYELHAEGSSTSSDEFCSRLLAMADSGQINEAENLLYEALDTSSLTDIETALIFYQHLSGFSISFLEKHNYSPEEIKLGLENIARATNCIGLTDLFQY